MPSSTFTGTLFLTYNRNSHEWQCSRRSYTISIRSQCDADQKRRLRRCDFSRWSQGFRVTRKVSSNSIHTLPSADANKKTFDDYTSIDQLALPCRLKYVSADWSVHRNVGTYPPIYKCRTTTTGRNYLPVVAFSFHRNCGLLIQRQYIA